MPAQYEGPDWLLVEYKGNNKYAPEKQLQNLKSHDCHVIMTQLLPVALRGLLPENVRLAIVKLCAFLNAISQKVIDPEIIPRLENDLVQCLVSFELVFPPSFFNIMTHVLVHLVDDIVILGPYFNIICSPLRGSWES